jgi:beta-glucanase (GH16 family)
LPPDIGTAWQPKFDLTFTGTRLDKSVWGTCYPWSPQNGCTNFGNPNEVEWYLPSQIEVSGGLLRLVAQRIKTQGKDRNGNGKTYACRSGMVTTDPGMRFQYGYLQVVARLPYGTGLWPALWLAPTNFQWPPEIDIVEHWNTDKKFFQHLHSTNGTVQAASEGTPNLSRGWTTFGLYWSANRLTWYVNGKKVMSTQTGIPQQPMYFIANLALEKAPPTGTCTGTMLVKSVKLWQQG